MNPLRLLSRHLYLRIWLAVVGGVAVLTLVTGWAWQVTAEHRRPPPTPREVVVRDGAGRVMGSGQAMPGRGPGRGLEFQVQLDNGQVLNLQLPPRPNRAPPAPPPPWERVPFGFAWMLFLVALAVTVGIYPVVRRLTKGLESLQRGVQALGEGDLSARVPVTGDDEVADLAQRFNAAAERIERLVQSHKSLLANASHELRSPLARIRMGLELMGERPSAAAREEISRNIAEVDQLISEILLASRLDSPEADMGTVETVDLTGMAAEECARTGASLEAGARTLSVPGVPRLVRRAVRNLLENARRHGTGEVTLVLEQTSRHAVIRVCDQGPGVPEALRERIFEPFYRLPGASEREGGVGLGLSLVQSIARRHAGQARCEANPGGGACFVIELPLHRSPP
jgi:signal transduction histidine kinase